MPSAPFAATSGNVCVKKSPTAEKADLMPSIAPETISLTFSHKFIQNCRNSSEVFHKYKKPATSPAMAAATNPMGFNDITKLTIIFDVYECFDTAISAGNAVKARISKIEVVFHTKYEKNILFKGLKSQ